ncbi:hypothetical protein HYY69_03145 [Candidatus Woesearchaeota archaeon]|nr:hypothetical protein [Candidatus Woesearchaeota archaeon]
MGKRGGKASKELEVIQQNPSSLRYLALVAIVAIVALMYMVSSNVSNNITVDTKHMEEFDIAGQAYSAVCEYDTDCDYGEECLRGKCVPLE